MKRLYYTLPNDTSLIIKPDAIAYIDGQPVLSYTYHLFLDTNDITALLQNQNYIADRNADPNYYGKITFDSPGNLFNYYEGNRSLTNAEVEEIIEHISHVRDTPNLWHMENL